MTRPLPKGRAMTRTIEIREGTVYYRGKHVGWLMSELTEHFGMDWNSDEPYKKYKVTIKPNGPYRFAPFSGRNGLTVLNADWTTLGVNNDDFVCTEKFAKLFFNPDCRKTYSITVKKVA